MASPQEFDRPQPIPIDELQALIGNTEKKAVLQLLAKPEERLSAHDFNDRFAKAQKPIGMVTYAAINNLQDAICGSHSTAGTYTTSEGLSLATWKAEKSPDSEIADSLAGHNLALTADYGLSLEEFWGKTSKSLANSLRSPQIRLRIFEALSALETGHSMSIPKLAAQINIKPSVLHKHIQNLYSFGFIEYEATDLQQQRGGSFEIVGNPDPALASLSQHGRRLRNYPDYGAGASIRTQLGEKLMQFQQDGKIFFSYDDFLNDRDDNSSGIPLKGIYPNILIGIMLREGILKRHHKTTSAGDQFSEISLDAQQKEIIDQAVSFHQGLRDYDPVIIQKGLELGSAIMADKGLVTELLLRGYDHSPDTKKQSYEERAAAMGSLLLGAGKEMSTRDIQEIFDEGKLSLSSIAGILRRMRESGAVKSSRVGNQAFWSPSDRKYFQTPSATARQTI